MQIIGIAIISTALCLVIKKDRPEIAMFIGILTGVIILTSVIFKLGFIIESINDLANKANIPSVYITLIIKLIGIAYLMEFAIQLCKDCGEGNIASKLEFGGKIIVMTMSFPILLSIDVYKRQGYNKKVNMLAKEPCKNLLKIYIFVLISVLAIKLQH